MYSSRMLVSTGAFSRLHFQGCAPLNRSLSKRSIHGSVVPDLFVHRHEPSVRVTGRPVVFIHGLLGSGTNFRTYQLKVATQRQTVAVDLRNHGRSPHTQGPMTLEMLAADVRTCITKLYGGQAVDIVGHSLGGKTAMLVALTQPTLVGRLIVVDIAPVAYDTSDAQWRSVDAIVRAAHDLNPEKYNARSEVDAQLAKAVSDPGVRSFVAQNLVPLQDGSYSWRINLPSIRDSMANFATFPTTVNRGIFAGPAQFIAGAKSSYIQPHHHDAIRAHFPNAQIHSVQGAGHWVHADKPREFWSLLADLLEMKQ